MAGPNATTRSRRAALCVPRMRDVAVRGRVEAAAVAGEATDDAEPRLRAYASREVLDELRRRLEGVGSPPDGTFRVTLRPVRSDGGDG